MGKVTLFCASAKVVSPATCCRAGIKVSGVGEDVADGVEMIPGVAVVITWIVEGTERGKIRSAPIWMNSRTAARAEGISIRLEMRTTMMVSDQTKRREMKRGRVEGRSRVATDPAMSGVRGYS